MSKIRLPNNTRSGPVLARPGRPALVALGNACVLALGWAGCGGRIAPAPSGDTAQAQAAETASDGGDAPGLTSTNLALAVSENACYGNGAQEYFQATNNSASAIPLSSITIKYWIYDTSAVNVQAQLWNGGCVTTSNGTCVHPVSGVTATATPFSPACGGAGSTLANWEITVSTTDSTPLAPGETWSDIQSAVNLANFANFSPGSSTWYSPCGVGQPFAANPNFGIYINGNLVDTLGITAPACRAPQGSQQLSGYFGPTPNNPSVAPLVGPVPPDTVLSLSIGLQARVPAGGVPLPTFVQQVSDPKNPNFRHFLTQSQFYASYGASAADYATLENWATSNGLTITETFASNLMLDVSGTALQWEQALFCNLDFRQRSDGSPFVAVDREPSLNLTLPILEIDGLTSFMVLKFQQQIMPNGTGGGGNYDSADLRAAYLGVGTPAGSSCQNLDGTGSLIALVEAAAPNANDIQQFDAAQTPPIFFGNYLGVAISQGGNPAAASFQEATLDVEAAQAIAPGAEIQVFQGSSGIAGHLDDILEEMADTAGITIASSSIAYGRSGNAQQAIEQMAAEGISFFQASGDQGDVGDPQDSADMDSQTLVGGTALSTNPVGTAPNIYPNNYYVSETTWNFQGGASGGGIENGNNENGNCLCWPHPTCCGSGVGIPDYQVNVNMSTNGGSTSNRNYPDVSMLADTTFEMVYQSTPQPIGGTSLAAPLWAGFTALIQQLGNNNGVGLLGFLNPTFYDIGLTQGEPTDLYAGRFNDITTGNNANGFGHGFNAVAGYDLATGWGSPTCELVFQVGTVTPLLPNTPLDEIQFIVITGNDNLRGNGASINTGFAHCGTGATAIVTLQNGTTFDVTLHNSNDDDGFDNNSHHTITAPLPTTISPPLSQTNGIASVTINIQEHDNGTCSPDNWDIADLDVSLLNPGSPPVCQLALTGTATLQDGSTGLVRLSNSSGSSGVGQTSPAFTTGASSGCP